MLAIAQQGTPAFVGGVLCDPLGAIDWGRPAAAGAFWCVLAIPPAFAAATWHRRRNVDTEGAHGHARLAEPGEMGDLMDEARPFNNIVFSQHTGIVLDADRRSLDEARRAINLNSVGIGVSGIGKTYSCVAPELMQAVGANLRPVKPGPTALYGNALARISPACAARRESRLDERWEEKRRRWAARGVGAGYDVLHSDPKGDNVRDLGQMFVDAGYDVRVINTVDFSQSDRFNPLALIPARMADACEPSQISFPWPDVREPGQAALLPDLKPLPANEEGVWSDEAAGIKVSAVAALETRDVDAGLGAAPEEARGFSLHRTRGTLRISVRWSAPRAAELMVTANIPEQVQLDGNISYDGAMCAGEPSVSEDGLRVAVPLVLRGAMDPATPSCASVVLPISLKETCVPDGVKLMQVVDTLVKNLGSSPAADEASRDPFWPDCKKLSFMSKIAYLFERYYPTSGYEHVNLSEVIDLLDEDLADTRNPADPSPMSERMDMWEHARRWEPGDDGAGRFGSAGSGRWVPTGDAPHPRSTSLAVHCYRAAFSAAPETVQSVVITCQAACVGLLAPDVRHVLSGNEVRLDELGEPGRGRAVFLVARDTDNPFEFVTSLVVQLAVDSCLERAYRDHGGRLPRHVRFVLDELPALGTIPSLPRALAVVRSRNVSMSLYVQSRDQLEKRYGKHDTAAIFDCCSTMQFLGSNNPDMCEMVSKRIGEETVFSEHLNRSFRSRSLLADKSESVSSNARRVMSPDDVAKMSKDEMLVFIYNHLPAKDSKFRTAEHGLYRHAYPRDGRRTRWMAAPVHAERFDYPAFSASRRAREAAAPSGAATAAPPEPSPSPRGSGAHVPTRTAGCDAAPRRWSEEAPRPNRGT